ncbi:ATP-binding cassette domain-containing protein, partial [Bacillus subtilis]|uniref:ATP-binding cassette domain-containing protein n=1 Tax=Bacillus subtilis TaxID=1423 RepID=UPI0011A8231C
MLKEINVEMEKGEVVVMMGAWGWGKRRLVRWMKRVERMNEGVLRVNGRGIKERKTDMNKVGENMGMVFEEFHLYGDKRV